MVQRFRSWCLPGLMVCLFAMCLSPSQASAQANFNRGDTNADGQYNMADVVYLFAYLFQSGVQPVCEDACDVSDDGSIDIGDGVFLLNFLFSNGAWPQAPNSCGPDPTPDNLDCVSFDPCSGVNQTPVITSTPPTEVDEMSNLSYTVVASDPDGVLAALNAAIVANNAITGSTRGPISEPTSSTSAFFDISEETHSLYAQLNFAANIFRGNIGFRYLDTTVESTGLSDTNGTITPTVTKGSYDFVLPRLNIVAEVHEDVLIRFGYNDDIRRPDFDDLSTSFTFSTSPNPPVFLGNPGLEPQEVTSIDLGVEWFFADNAMVSLGYFHKDRTGLFVRQQEDPFEDPVTGFRDITPPCEAGGIFNPIADINVFGPPGVGVCVPVATIINGAGSSTQEGFEILFQYDLSIYEDTLGWASGFGVLANFTTQEFDGPEEFWDATSRASTVFAANGNTNVDLRANLIDLSENAYNITVFYEKYGISARARYTWREAYRSTDFGSTSSFPWGFPVVQDDRGQLNVGVNYLFDNGLTVGVEAVNLTEEDVTQYCVNQNALLCYQGLTDRRITFGASYRF